MRRTPPTRNAETRERVRAAIQSLPWREQKVIGLYYYGEVTMKQIGAEIGVNESRVSQLHARAIKRLRDALGEMNPQQAVELRHQLVAFATAKPKMAKADIVPAAPGVLLEYKPRVHAARTQATAAGPRRQDGPAAPTGHRGGREIATITAEHAEHAERSISLRARRSPR